MTVDELLDWILSEKGAQLEKDIDIGDYEVHVPVNSAVAQKIEDQIFNHKKKHLHLRGE